MAHVAKEAAALCALLANENRVLILHHLMGGPLNVSQLHKRLKDITQSALSQHLSLLRANRIVECDKQGQNMIYSIVDPGAIELMGTVRRIFALEHRPMGKSSEVNLIESRTGDECI